jgi:hypothetical protein
MKGFQVAIVVSSIALGGLAVGMAVTNPNQTNYQDYAAQKLSLYLKEKVCPQISNKIPKGLGIEDFLVKQCLSMVDIGKPQFQQLIGENTQRQNLLLFSIYRTDLSLAGNLPDYHFETLGIFNNFYTYQAQEQ